MAAKKRAASEVGSRGQIPNQAIAAQGRELNWVALVSASIHPTKVAILEAIAWLGTPISSAELERMLGDDLDLSDISYHMGRLFKLGVVEKVTHRSVRGARETYYYLTAAVTVEPKARS